MYKLLAIQYRPIIKWRFLKQLIEEDGWIVAIIAVLLIIIIDDILNDGVIFEFIRPVTSRIGCLLKKIDHSVQSYPNEEKDKRTRKKYDNYDEAELTARTDALSAEVEEAKKRIEQRNRYKQGIYSEEQKRVIEEAREYFRKYDPEGLEIYESALEEGAEPIETFKFLKSMW